ncbi:uncharacterized protein LOC141627696 [Silene latifolia]|uniref:uncharacterized protein LOC141627696 n=1 Tax=Silene latifolia TaxID=37657 RepID=UPI003D775C89
MRVSEIDGTAKTKKRNQEFNEWLLTMGDGRFQAKPEPHEDEATWIKIPEGYVYSTGKIDIKSMVQEIYPNFLTRTEDHNYLRERAILTPINENTDSINEYMVDLMPGTYKVYMSCDEVCASSIDREEQFTAYPTEYLNSLKLQGLPNHTHKLMVGMPVMLLRNINPSRGLCNGTRLIITRTGNFIVEATIITGSQVGKQVLI